MAYIMRIFLTVVFLLPLSGCNFIPDIPTSREEYPDYRGRKEAPVHGGYRIDKNYDGRVDKEYRGRHDVFERDGDRIYTNP